MDSDASMMFLRLCRLPLPATFDPKDIEAIPSPPVTYQADLTEDTPTVPNGFQVEVFKDGQRMLSLCGICQCNVLRSLSTGVDVQVHFFTSLLSTY